ncbi:unnamed protein product [Amaranthus hypochondriacus]
MATSDDNNEMIDIEPSDAQPTAAGKLESEHVNSELADSAQTSSEDVRPQSVNPEDVCKEQLEKHIVCSESVEKQPDSVSTEVVHTQLSSADVMCSGNLNSTEASDEMFNSKPAEELSSESQYSNSQAEHILMVKSEQIKPEPMDLGEASLQNMDEHADPHTTHEEHESTQLAHPEPLGEEVEYSPSGSSKHMLSQPVSSEHLHSENLHSQTASLQLMHPQSNSVMEHMQSLPMSSEDMASQAFNSECVHSQAVSAELAHSQPGNSEVFGPQPASADHVYSQPLSSSDIDLSQPITSELVHLPHAVLEPAHLQPVGMELVSSQSHGAELANSCAVSMELVNAQPLSTEISNTQLQTPETQPNKRRKKKSIVWEHFTIESVGPGCRRAYCKVCKQSFAYSTGSKVAGTSHLKRHIAKGTCPVVLRQQEKNQLSPYMPKSGGTDGGNGHQPKRRYRSSTSPYLIFDQDRCRQEIARMIIMHDYPLHMVEHPGFVSFVQNLQPRFDMVSFNIVQGDCVAIFLREKQNLQRFIAGIPGKICLTVDLWTSTLSIAYVFVTGQFIDSDWKLHRRLLNVVMEPFPESDRALSHAIGTSLSDWGLDRKLASITFNQALSENALDQLRALLAVKNPMLLDGQLLVRSCIARTLSSMAQEVIAASEKTIKKVRTSVKYVKTSESHEEKFSELKQQLQVPTEKSLSLDNITKWNTTYEMLLAASELKQVFSCLDTCDLDYKDAPSMEDWKEVENILMYLKLLFDTANLLMSEPTPSSNVFFHEVWKIQLELARAAASDDLFVAGLAKPLQDKFHKYWKNSCLVLAVAVAMDPRFKMKLVEFSFTKIFMDEAPVYIRIVDEGLHELFQEYLTVPLPLTPLENNNVGNVGGEDHHLNNNGLSDFDMYIMETSSQQMKSELDQYLEESLLPRVQDFDVLGWWKLNKLKYPTLSKMARDILSVPLSTVSPDAVFAISMNEMDSYRCSLRPETLEALICAKDWLKTDSNIVSKEQVKMGL